MPDLRRCRVFATSLVLLAGLITAQSALTAPRVEALVKSAHERFGGAGVAVAVVQDGDVLAEVAFGERAAGKPMTPETLCNIASCSKAFTAAAVALLVEQGKLGWNDRVVDHVPEFRMADPWITAHMTIADLLSHRCGLVTFAGDLLWYDSDYDEAEVLRRIEKLPIEQRFREQFGYQNLMYMVAGIIVQRTSGVPWEDFVEQHFFAPLGMVHSRASAQRLPPDAEKALPHIDGEVVPDHEFVACKPAAAIYASVHELTAWMRMLLAGGKWGDKSLVDAASLQEMWRPHVMIGGGAGPGTGDFRSYGMGWFLSLERGKKLVEHDGGMPGFLSKVSLLPAERFGFVVLNNANDGVLNEAIKRSLLAERTGGDGMAEVERLAEIGKRLHSREQTAARQRAAKRHPDTTPSLPLSAYTGTYVDDVYGPAEVTLAEGTLHLVLVPGRRRLFGALSHWHYDTFRVDFPDKFLPFALVRFEIDHTGACAGFRIDCPIPDFDFGALRFEKQPAEAR
ncbi:MAG TPA: serine hydrolase [Planctomycetota bacterium]|nr:serine hydrolase [Planctomycetota bacterium]